jgi:PAS domain S-box-containing protein
MELHMSRILVIEDSPTQAQMLTTSLAAEGFDFQVVADGQQGLKLVQGCDFDLVVTDVLTPELSGCELCRRIKDDPAHHHVPVILLTALADPVDIVRAIASGADSVIPKPLDTALLLARIRSLFANRSLRAQSKLKAGIEAILSGQSVTITSDKEQILDLLLSTCEEIIRANRALQGSRDELHSARARVEQHNEQLADRARLSEQKYHTLMEGANDAIFLLDSTGKVLEANHRAEELLGQTRMSIQGRPFDEMMPPAERDGEREAFRQLLVSGNVRADNVRFCRANGELVNIDWSASLVTVDGQQLVFVIVRDATERTRLEEKLRQAQKMEAVGRLAGGVAHDFNNLLTVINGYSELIQAQLSRDHPARALIAEVTKAGDRAATLTRRLLAFSRQQVIAPRVLDLNEVVADTEKMLRRLIGEDIELTTTPGADLGHIKADPGQVEQIIVNLAVNARDAMPTGGKLTLATWNAENGENGAQPAAKVQPTRYVILAVMDTGCGMDAATQAHLFEPFFTTKQMGKGTGLGLATVDGIVKQMGGFIEVDSGVGQGTVFRIFLPRVDEPVTGKSSPTLGFELTGTETILLVEDQGAVRELATQALRLCGYTVLEADNAHAALAINARHTAPIHLLVTDVVMPGMSGRELAARLTILRPEMKVLYLSGYTNDAVVQRGVLHEEAHFLQKPFTGTILARTVRAMLDPASAAQPAGEVRGSASSK